MVRGWRWSAHDAAQADALPFQRVLGDYQGDDNPNIIYGDDGQSNQIYGYGGDDQLFGGNLDDLIYGGDDNDRLIGGDGPDEMHGDDGDDLLKGNAGDDMLYSGAGTDKLNGDSGNDTLFVSSDEVSAGDVWNGGKGDDSITLDASAAAQGYTIDLTGVHFRSVENFELDLSNQATILMTGTEFARFDSFQTVGDQYSTVVLTTGGKIELSDDARYTIGTLDFSDIATKLNLSHVDAMIGVMAGTSINGGAGDDVITGNNTVGTIINGGGGNDTLTGGKGIDWLSGDAGSDVLKGGAGDDHLLIDTSQADRMYGGSGNDYLDMDVAGGVASGTLVDGGSGLDALVIPSHVSVADISNLEISGVEQLYSIYARSIYMTADQLSMFSYLGQPEYVFVTTSGEIDISELSTRYVVEFHLSAQGNELTGSDKAFTNALGSEMNDTMISGIAGGSFSAYGGDDILTVVGSVASSLSGGDGNDSLQGGLGADYISGDGDNDLIIGGGGIDALNGGAGADRFIYQQISDFQGSTSGTETIQDFSHDEGDKIDLSAIDPDAKLAGDQSFTFIGTAAFTHTAGQYEIRYDVQSDGSLLVQGDVNHDGKADFTLLVQNAAALVATDFVL